MNKKFILFVFVTVLFFAFGASAGGQELFNKPNTPDPGIPDTVRVETKTVPATDSFTVDVFLYNDEELGGISIPLTWNSADFELDTVLFDGSRIDYVGTKPIKIDNTIQQVLVGAIVFFEEYIQPGSGLLFTMHFRAKPGISDQMFNIDTLYFDPGGSFGLTLTTGFNIYPQFVEGEITWGNPVTNPTIGLSPTSFAFTAVEGGANPASQSLTVTNTGEGTLNWTASNNTGWLSLTPTSGTGDGSVTVAVDITGLAAGTFYDTITVSDPTATNDPQRAAVTLTVEEPPPTISLDPTGFSYTITQGGGLPDDQLSVTNTGGGTLNWTASNTAGWLTITPMAGVGDATILLSFGVGALTPGTYYDTITVSDPAATNDPQRAAVTLTVEEPPPTIAVDPISFSYTITEGDVIPNAQLAITNTGGGTLNWTASNAAPWLTLDPVSGSGDATITLSFDVAGIPAGTYYDTITVSDPAATNDPVAVPVTVTIEAAPVPVIGVSPSSFAFDAEEGGANPSDQALSITNIGEGTLDWTVSATSGWLDLNPTSGSGDGSVTLSVDITGLAAGTYIDTVTVTDPSASNSPVAVPVTLTIEAQPELAVSPTSIDITATEGDAIPSETITVMNSGGGVLTWTASNTGAWLTLTPTSGGDSDTLITVDFDITGMTAGMYYDTIVISSPEATNSPQNIPVTLTIEAQPPTIVLDPTLIEVSAFEGGTILDRQIAVTNSGGGTLNWTAANQTGWITLDPTGGTGDGIITLSFDITGVGPGLYTDTITVSDPAATNNPQAAVVILTVLEPLPDADTVYVETVSGIPGQQVMVGVDYANYAPTYGFTLPLSFDPGPVDCDSVSFQGTRIDIADESWVVIDNVNGTIVVQGFLINAPILNPGSGLIAKAFFSVDGAAAEQFVAIDTTADGGFLFEDSTHFKKTEFFAGGIDISATPCFEFPTDTVAFDINVGEIIPSISFPVTNGCGGMLEWTVSVGDAWAIVTPTSGVQDDQVTFTVDTTGLAPGSYATTATFESNGTGTPYDVIVTLNFTHYPEIAVSPQVFNIGSVCQGDTIYGSFEITNSGGGVLNWQADAIEDIPLSAYTGTAPSTISFEVRTASVPYGPQTAEIGVMSNDAINSPQTVFVKFTVVNCDDCSFDVAEVEGANGQAVSVPIYAYGIAEAAGVQFNIAYDPAVVAPDSVTSAYMAGPTIGFADDAVHYVWDDFNNPITVPDGEPIIVMWFTITGDPGQMSCFNWTGINEVADVNGIPFAGLSFCGGCLTVVEPFFDLSGTVVYYDMTSAVADVTVDLTGDAAASTLTDDHGEYMFMDIAPGGYVVTPSRFDDDEGVSVGDAVEMRRHIAFVEIFDSPYKLIAADINLSGTVTVSDVILVRRYLTELDPLASGNWIFVDADYTITMDNWPLAPHEIAVTVVGSGHDMLDFIAIRMGDVDGTWSQPKAVADGSTEIELTIPELDGAPAEEIVVPVNAAGFVDVAGVESHINYDQMKMTIDSITSHHLNDPTVNAVDGRIHFIWEDFTAPMTVGDSEPFMLIHARVLPTATGNIEMSFTGDCEMVNETGNPYPIILNDGMVFITPTDADDDDSRLPGQFSLKQNFPNPFNPTTTISYTVDHTMELVFEVYNVSGQLVDRIDLGQNSTGSYSFVYHAGTLPSGVYTYRLVGDGISRAKQMLLLK